MQNFAYSISRLKDSKDTKAVQASHDAVVTFWSPHNANREQCTRYVDGEHYTPEELAAYEATNRVPVVMNQFGQSKRTILGMFLSNHYDVEFSPVESDDQELAETLQKLAAHEAEVNDDQLQDAVMAVEAWIGGNSFRVCWPETEPGERPFLCSANLNPFAVYWDPESRNLVSRTDAKFVDVVFWMTLDEIAEKWPSAKIPARYQDSITSDVGPESYTPVDSAADRAHEVLKQRNGRFQVIERWYKVVTASHYYFDEPSGEWYEVKDAAKMREMMPDVKLVAKRAEQLWIAQWSPEVTEGNEFLRNEMYHAQPRDPKTRKIIWPILELVCDFVGSKPKGYVQDNLTPSKLFDVLVTNIIESAKHAPSSYEVDRSAYISEEEADSAVELGAHSGQRFEVKPGRAGTGMRPIEKASVSQDHDKGISIAKQHFQEAGSTPPAVQGLSESGAASGVLNGQRIEQAYLQNTGFITFFRLYRTQLNRLRYAYSRQFYTDEMVIRVAGANGGNEVVTLNKEVQALDQFGFPIRGATTKLNDIQGALYDVRLVDSVKSPTHRDKQLKTLEMLIQSNAVAQDPPALQMLLQQYIRLTDMDQSIKQQFEQRAKQVVQNTGVQDQLQSAQLAQQVAQTEAEQTTPQIPASV